MVLETRGVGGGGGKLGGGGGLGGRGPLSAGLHKAERGNTSCECA